MQSRIDRLEGLVLSLMSGNSNNVSSPKSDARSSSLAAPLSRQGSRDGDADADEDDDDMGYDEPDELEAGIQPEPLNVEEDVEEVRNALGFMKVHCGKTFYRGETHWAALLSEVLS